MSRLDLSSVPAHEGLLRLSGLEAHGPIDEDLHVSVLSGQEEVAVVHLSRLMYALRAVAGIAPVPAPDDARERILSALWAFRRP